MNTAAAPHNNTHAHGTTLIDLEKITFAYPGRRPVLRELDFHFHAGQHLGLVAPNGSGKTTLFHIIMGLLKPDSGRVTILGEERTQERDFVEVRRRIGLLFQDPDDQLFSPTVREDVAFGPIHMGVPEHELHHRVERALAAVGMSGFEQRVPHHLSLGQRKRIAVATVLSMDPSVLVFDEPTAGLDPRGRRELMAVMAGRPETLLVSTHDLAMVAETLPRTVILDEGAVVADGPSAELLRDEALLEAHGLESPYRLPGS